MSECCLRITAPHDGDAEEVTANPRKEFPDMTNRKQGWLPELVTLCTRERVLERAGEE